MRSVKVGVTVSVSLFCRVRQEFPNTRPRFADCRECRHRAGRLGYDGSTGTSHKCNRIDRSGTRTLTSRAPESDRAKNVDCQTGEITMNQASVRCASAYLPCASNAPAANGLAAKLTKASTIALILCCAGFQNLDGPTLRAAPPTEIKVLASDVRPANRVAPTQFVGKPDRGVVLAVRQVQVAPGDVEDKVPQRPQPARPMVPVPKPTPLVKPPIDPAVVSDRPIGSITTNIRPAGGVLPSNEAKKVFIDKDRIPDDLPPYRLWEPLGYCWESPALCHRPLYFEEVNLERYGYTSPRMRLLQPAVSGARFFATVPALPYLINARPPCECVYTLGHYRPGSCVPYRRHWPELRVLPTSVEAAAATGLVFLIP